MRIKTICSLQTRKAMACARNRANQPRMKSSTCRTAHTWKNMIRGSWLDLSLFSHVGKAIRDIWLVYIGLQTKIYSAAFQCVNLSMYVISSFISYILRFSHQILRCEKAFRILLRPIREAKRVSHTWKNRFVQSQTSSNHGLSELCFRGLFRGHRG